MLASLASIVLHVPCYERHDGMLHVSAFVVVRAHAVHLC